MTEHTDMRKAAVAAGLVVLLALSVATAGAQDGPYGSTTTTTTAPRRATIALTVTSGPPGTDVGVFACGYDPGAEGGSLTFDGTVLAAGLIANGDGCLTGTGNAPPGGAPVTVRVPPTARPGNHNVCSMLPGYNTPCARFRVTTRGRSDEHRAEVRGESIGRTSNGGSSAPPRIAAALLLALAVFVVGRMALTARGRRPEAK